MNIHLHIFVTTINILVSMFIFALYLYFKKSSNNLISKNCTNYRTNIFRSIFLIFLTTIYIYNFYLPKHTIMFIILESNLLLVVAYRLKNLISL